MDEKLVPEFQPPRKYTGNYSIAAMYTLENVVFDQIAPVSVDMFFRYT